MLVQTADCRCLVGERFRLAGLLICVLTYDALNRLLRAPGPGQRKNITLNVLERCKVGLSGAKEIPG
jgi:hypothetical protein